MKNRSEDAWQKRRDEILGLGEASIRKSHYPSLRQRMAELEQFRMLLDVSSDLLFILEVPSARICDVNQTACERLCSSRESLCSGAFTEIVDGTAAGQFGQALEDFATGRGESATLTVDLLVRDGSRFVAELAMRHVVAAGDHFAVVSARDITQRKRAEEALRDNEERFRFLAENMADIVWTLDLDFKTTYISPSIKKVLGFTPEERKRQTLQEMVTPKSLQRVVAMLAEEIQRDADQDVDPERHVTAEVEFYHAEGHTVWMENSLKAIRDDAGAIVGIYGSSRDITERRRLEEQLRHASKMEAVGQLASGVAHEFNNLLFGILGSADLISSAPEVELPEQSKRSLQDIVKCGQRGAALTRQLLAFARKKAPEVSLFDINQVAAGIEVVLRRLAGELIAFELVLASDLPPIQADKGEIEQAIMNLARNACDAMPDGGRLTIQTATEELDARRASANRHARPGRFVQLSVADTGCGMAPETVQRVFEPFFTTKPVGKGTGLGLSTVFADVTRSGGFIEIESRLDEGTEFRVWLPAAAGSNVAASHDAQPSLQHCPGGNETILVCDDDEIVLDSAAFLLEARGYSVIRACGGRIALEAAQSHHGTIELLLTDVSMPEMNGWELAKKLTLERPDMKVVFMSGYAEDVLEAGAADGEHVEFVQKPPEGDTLFRRIREVLDATRMPATDSSD